MTILYEMVLIGAVAMTAVFLWHQIKTRQQIHAINVRLSRMQKDVNVLRLRESRRALMAFRARSNAEPPQTEPDDGGPVNIGSHDIVTLTGATCSTSVHRTHG